MNNIIFYIIASSFTILCVKTKDVLDYNFEDNSIKITLDYDTSESENKIPTLKSVTLDNTEIDHTTNFDVSMNIGTKTIFNLTRKGDLNFLEFFNKKLKVVFFYEDKEDDIYSFEINIDKSKKQLKIQTITKIEIKKFEIVIESNENFYRNFTVIDSKLNDISRSYDFIFKGRYNNTVLVEMNVKGINWNKEQIIVYFNGYKSVIRICLTEEILKSVDNEEISPSKASLYELETSKCKEVVPKRIREPILKEAVEKIDPKINIPQTFIEDPTAKKSTQEEVVGKFDESKIDIPQTFIEDPTAKGLTQEEVIRKLDQPKNILEDPKTKVLTQEEVIKSDGPKTSTQQNILENLTAKGSTQEEVVKSNDPKPLNIPEDPTAKVLAQEEGSEKEKPKINKPQTIPINPTARVSTQEEGLGKKNPKIDQPQNIPKIPTARVLTQEEVIRSDDPKFVTPTNKPEKAKTKGSTQEEVVESDDPKTSKPQNILVRLSKTEKKRGKNFIDGMKNLHWYFYVIIFLFIIVFMGTIIIILKN